MYSLFRVIWFHKQFITIVTKRMRTDSTQLQQKQVVKYLITKVKR